MNALKNVKFLLVILISTLSFQTCSSKTETAEQINSDTSQKETSYAEASPSAQNSRTAQDNIASSRQNAITRAVKKCRDAIVGINVTEVREVEYRSPFDSFFDDPFFRRFFGERYPRRTRKYQVHGLGSGFIISPDGYILTNHHVAGNASKVLITMTDGKKFDAEIIGADKTSDVCLLKIDGDNLPYLELGNSDEIYPGEWAIAFGNPFGLFDMNAKPTVTVGVVSNSDVNMFHSDGRVYKGMIQTDAAISSGNSGGPLVNSLGEVIGMNTVIFSTAQSNQGAGSIGIGFSIPINRVKKIVELLKKYKRINRNFYTGLDVREIDEQVVRYLDLEVEEGVYIFGIERNSPAEDAGLEPGDVIYEVNGQRILRDDDFLIEINDAIAGQTMKFTIIRQGKKLKKEMLLRPRDRR